jgi:hypothetical protein
MKKSILKLMVVISFGIGSTTSTVNAQGDATRLLRSGVSDANKLFNGYLSPLMSGFASGMNNGWYQTAKAHGTGGFDITINTGLFIVPSKDQSFDLASLGLNTDPSKPRIVPQGGAALGSTPTIFGEDKPGIKVDVMQRYNIPGFGTRDTAISTFEMPPGLGINQFLYLPNAQLCVGIVKNTDLIVRFIPTISAGNFKAGAFGIGVKHDFKQWIPGIAEAPFDMSAIVVYNTANATYEMGDDYIKPEVTYGALPDAEYKSQSFDFKLNGFMLGAIISKKLGPLTPFLGLQYNNAQAKLNVNGTYPVTFVDDSGDPISNPNFGQPKVENLKDPISISGNANGVRLNAGLRMKLGPITFHGDYTLAKYSTINFGFGINIQSIAPFKL